METTADNANAIAFIGNDDDHINNDSKLHSDTQIRKSKSVLKKRKHILNDGGVGNWMMLCVWCFSILPSVIECQFTPRDPRWYSREGDYNYHWPSPGDPEYR